MKIDLSFDEKKSVFFSTNGIISRKSTKNAIYVQKNIRVAVGVDNFPTDDFVICFLSDVANNSIVSIHDSPDSNLVPNQTELKLYYSQLLLAVEFLFKRDQQRFKLALLKWKNRNII